MRLVLFLTSVTMRSGTEYLKASAYHAQTHSREDIFQTKIVARFGYYGAEHQTA